MLDFKKENIRALFLDMDGVLWRDSEAIGDLPAIFRKINELGLQVVLATNNATRLVPQYQDKLAGMGVYLEPGQIATSGQAVIYHLQEKYPVGTGVYVVGMPSLVKQITDAGYSITDQNALVVVAGVDRQITYEKIQIASSLIRNGAEFIGTNPDKTFPTPHGLVPGAGAIIAAVATAAEQEPVFAGKPGRILMEMSYSRLHGIQPGEVLMVGDRIETDIAAGINFGCKTALVLSGVTTPAQAQKADPRPGFIFNDLAQLVGVIG